MRRVRKISWVALMTASIALLAVSVFSTKTGWAASSNVLLSGTVKAEAGEKMEGVTVSARGEGQTITTSVFTDEQGNYFFPPTLAKGKYRVWAQAEGYQAGRAEVELGGGVQHQDFLLKTMKDFTKQMTGAEYISALPEDTPQHIKMKDIFRHNCTGCHEASYILQNRFDQKGWEAVIDLMNMMTNGSGNYAGQDEAPFPIINYYKKDLVAYLAEMRGPGPSPMKIKVRPRPTGDAARAVVTEYALPVADANAFDTNAGYGSDDGSDWSLGTPSRLNGVGGVHDTQMDKNGNIWFTHAQPSFIRSLGMVDGKTGKVTDIKVPTRNGMAAFTHGLTIDKNGILWFTAAGAGTADASVGSLGRIDPNTMKFEIYSPPKGMSGVSLTVDVDAKGYIWASTPTGALRFDPNTHQFTEFKSPTQISPSGTGETYGMTGDSEGNGWWTQMYIDTVDKGDVQAAKSLELKLPPVASKSDGLINEEDRKVHSLAGIFMSDFGGFWSQGPRRLAADKNADVVWVCDYWSGNLAKFDIHSLKPTFYPFLTPESATYAAVVDKNHNVWVNLLQGDSVGKFDPKTEQWTEYPLPTRGLEMRHIAASEWDGTTQIVLGYFRTGKVARLQFRSKEELQALSSQAHSLHLEARAQ